MASGRTALALLMALCLPVAVVAGDESEAIRTPLQGACYLRFGETVECVVTGSERSCRQQCDEAACDEPVWFAHLACWQWLGYGG